MKNICYKIDCHNYATESSLFSSLLLDLAKPEYQDAISALSGCAELIADTYGVFTNTCAQVIADINELVKKGKKKPEPEAVLVSRTKFATIHPVTWSQRVNF